MSNIGVLKPMYLISHLPEVVKDGDWFIIEKEPDSVIRVATTPEGDAPLKWREKWIGSEMEAVREEDSTGEITLIEGKPTLPRGPIYTVARGNALDALALKSPDAANWFRTNLRDSVTHLSFSASEVIELSLR